MSNHIKTSKLISYLLRHNPGKKGLVLDSNGFTTSDTLTVGKVNTDQVNRAFRDPNAPTAFQATYYNTNNEKFVGYKRLAIKIVMTSESTAKAPVLQDFRAIAVSL